LSKKPAIVALATLMTVLAAPAFAREHCTPNRPFDSYAPDVRAPLYARGADVEGFARQGSGFGRWPLDILIECRGDRQAQHSF